LIFFPKEALFVDDGVKGGKKKGELISLFLFIKEIKKCLRKKLRVVYFSSFFHHVVLSF
jgi:hypothetical protein